MLLFITYLVDYNDILRTLRQCNCRDVCKKSLCSLGRTLNQSTQNFNQILISIGTPLLGRVPKPTMTKLRRIDTKQILQPRQIDAFLWDKYYHAL